MNSIVERLSHEHSRQGSHGDADRKRIWLAGAVGLAGIAATLVANVAGVMANGVTDMVSDTISDLAAGKHAWIMDAGLYAFVIGLFGVAYGLLLERKGGGWLWRAGLITLVLVGLSVFIIAIYGEYGDRDSGGFKIHLEMVYALAALFGATTFLLAPGFRRYGSIWMWFSLGLGIAWLVTGPIFFFVPTSWDGLYERFVALLMLIWVAGISWQLIGEGRAPEGLRLHREIDRG